MKFIACDGDLVQAKAGPTNVSGVLSCTSSWTVVTEEELLNQALSNHLLSRDDFNTLSAWILAIMVAAMGLRMVLKTFHIGEKTIEK